MRTRTKPRSIFARRMQHIKSHAKKDPSIVVDITKLDIRNLYFRDKAHSMKHASLQRVDKKGPFSFANCHFIDLEVQVIKEEMWKTGDKTLKHEGV